MHLKDPLALRTSWHFPTHSSTRKASRSDRVFDHSNIRDGFSFILQGPSRLLLGHLVKITAMRTVDVHVCIYIRHTNRDKLFWFKISPLTAAPSTELRHASRWISQGPALSGDLRS